MAKGISRIEKDKGWNARYYANGQAYSRFFADAKFGGSSEAEAAAQNYLNEMAASISKPEKKHTYNITEGTAVGGLGGNSRFWNVSYQEDGNLKNKKFYFSNEDERIVQLEEARKFKNKVDQGEN